MAIVRLYANLRQVTGVKETRAPGNTVQAVLTALCTQLPGLADKMFENGQLRPHFILSVNGHHIELGQGLETPLAEEDVLAIFPPIAGGVQ